MQKTQITVVQNRAVYNYHLNISSELQRSNEYPTEIEVHNTKKNYSVQPYNSNPHNRSKPFQHTDAGG